jgi:type IV secretion system protein VirD4
MANCHVRIAYAPNTIETARVLSDMAGKTTVVSKKYSHSGSSSGALRNSSRSVSETGRPLLTPDECMRLPGLEKDSQGNVTRPGDMLIFTAGQSPIYGRQFLYFRDPVFSKRSKIPVPGVGPDHPNGLSDSIYYPRGKAPSLDGGASAHPARKETEEPKAAHAEASGTYQDYLGQ